MLGSSWRKGRKKPVRRGREDRKRGRERKEVRRKRSKETKKNENSGR